MNSSFYRIATKTAVVILMILNICGNIKAFVAPTMCANPQNNNKLSLRNSQGVSGMPEKTINCNKKYLYINYLLTLRSVKKTIKYSSNNDILYNINCMIENIMNISTLNSPNLSESKDSLLLTGNARSEGVSSVIINDEFIAKKLLLANIQIDVSNIKYIQISTKNDTLIVELDKKNSLENDNFVKYDLKNMDAMISAISILMNLLNVH
jgi:hypothetical protein